MDMTIEEGLLNLILDLYNSEDKENMKDYSFYIKVSPVSQEEIDMEFYLETISWYVDELVLNKEENIYFVSSLLGLCTELEMSDGSKTDESIILHYINEYVLYSLNKVLDNNNIEIKNTDMSEEENSEEDVSLFKNDREVLKYLEKEVAKEHDLERIIEINYMNKRTDYISLETREDARKFYPKLVNREVAFFVVGLINGDGDTVSEKEIALHEDYIQYIMTEY